MSTTIASLPRELVDIITRQASHQKWHSTGSDAETLCRLALVSRQWRNAAQAALWKDLLITSELNAQACLASQAFGRHITTSLNLRYNSETVLLLVAALRGVKTLLLCPSPIQDPFDSTLLQLPAFGDLKSLWIHCDLEDPVPRSLPFRLRHLSILITLASGNLRPLLTLPFLDALTSLQLFFRDPPIMISPTILEALEKIAPQLAHLDVIVMPALAHHPFFAPLLRSSRKLNELRIGPGLDAEDALHILSAIPETLATFKLRVHGAEDLRVLEEWLRSPGSPQRLEVLELGTSDEMAEWINKGSGGSSLLAWCKERDVRVCLSRV